MTSYEVVLDNAKLLSNCFEEPPEESPLVVVDLSTVLFARDALEETFWGQYVDGKIVDADLFPWFSISTLSVSDIPPGYVLEVQADFDATSDGTYMGVGGVSQIPHIPLLGTTFLGSNDSGAAPGTTTVVVGPGLVAWDELPTDWDPPRMQLAFDFDWGEVITGFRYQIIPAP